ncbi:MAG: IS1 family transposase [Candidatus Electronema sp. V4]|uniref:IS1 family transposase n=1 Tax=Candidatus Electronema sp. V4 TaxID=3454756 RepID=UPI004055497B
MQTAGGVAANTFHQKNAAGKANTWKTERGNLNFRIHLKHLNRKTVCFSKR